MSAHVETILSGARESPDREWDGRAPAPPPCLSGAPRGIRAERRRIADELHDVLGVRLVALLLQVRQLADHPDPDVRRTAAAVDHLVQQMMAEVRALVGALHTTPAGTAHAPGADGMPCLTSHLAELAASFPDGLVRLAVQHAVPAPAVPSEVAHAAAHVVAEGIVNAVRHGTGRVDVAVRIGESLTVDVGNAAGRDVPRQARTEHPGAGGHGLPGMRRRVEARGGTFHAGRGSDGRFGVRAVFALHGAAARRHA